MADQRTAEELAEELAQLLRAATPEVRRYVTRLLRENLLSPYADTAAGSLLARALADDETPPLTNLILDQQQRTARRQQWRDLLETPEGKRDFIERAIQWIVDNWVVPRQCPHCRTTEWEVGTPLELQTARDEALTPHFPVMCAKCGNTVFINAVRAGLVPEPPASENP